jgi:gluconate 2-dehydrogenase gamma chain
MITNLQGFDFKNKIMNRREAIQKATLALGFALSAPVLTGVLQGCKPTPELTYKPVFFNEDQAQLISQLSEIILPKTATPGAIEAGVPGFIDNLIKEVYSKEDKEAFIKGLTEFDEEAKKVYGNHFAECTPEQQKEFVKKHHDAAYATKVEGASGSFWDAAKKNERPFILKVKELTLIGFFTSEAGATQVLQYNQVPGPFKGCVPLTEVGKAWAT